MAEPTTFSRIWLRLATALSAVAALSVASFGLTTYISRSDWKHAQTINVSGRQRMLSQRSTLYAVQATQASGAEREALLETHAALVDLFEASHQGLVGRGVREELKEVYFGEADLDRRIRTFVALHRSFAEALARGAEAEAQSRLQVAIQRAPALLSDLHAAVVAYETIAHRAAHDLLITEAGLLLLLLGVLAGLGGLYLRPMARSFAEQLEEVEAAKAESERHRHAVQLVLDGSGDGLLLCSLDGDIGEVVSTNIIMWFGPFEGRKIWELLYDDDEERQASLQLLVEEIKDDIMPFEVVVDQMTRRIQGWDGQTFEFDIRKVDLGFDEPQLLFTVRDITAALAAQRIAQAYEEIQTLVSRVVKDVRGFRGFVADQTALMDALDDRSLDAKQIARILHTLKGNASLFGMAGFAQSCHSLEDQLDIDGPPDDIGEWADALRVSWRGFAFLVEDFLTDDEDAVQVSSQEHAEVVAALEAAAVDPQLLARVQTWTWEPAELRLRRLADQAAELGERIGKAVDVEVVAPELRVPKTYLERFWPTLVHVVRNSLDHGIEAAEDREAAGKPSKGRLRFEARRDEEAFVLTLSDDGAGIDWDRLRAKASEKGLSVEHTADVLFLDGVSSRDAVSDLSGRGVGMADVKATAEVYEGRIETLSERGKGTRFRFTFPAPTTEDEEIVLSA